MQAHERKALSQARMEHAVECLSAARNLLETKNYKSAANRSYYAVFHAMRAVLAFDEIDMKHQRGIISEEFLSRECRKLFRFCSMCGLTVTTMTFL